MKHFNLLNNFRWFATIILLITLSVGQMWGAGAISMSTEVKIYPKSSTSVSQNDWGTKGAPNAYSATKTTYTINSDGSFDFYNAADFNNTNLLQLKASGGYIQTVISSPAGVDVYVGYKTTSTNNLTISLTGAPSSVNVNSTSSYKTAKISTTTTSATLKLHKNSNGAAYISFVVIIPKVDVKSGDYVLIENSEDIETGRYLIVYNNTMALNTHYGNTDANTYGTYTDISSYYSSKTITANATTNALAYDVVKSRNGYCIKKVSENTFLGTTATSGTGALLRWDTYYTSSVDEWGLDVNSIESKKYTTYAIRWLNTSGQYRFAIYGKANQQPVQLFKKVAASCSADPTVGNASLNGSFNLTTVGVQCASITPGTNCSVASGDYGFIWYERDGTKKEIGGSGVTKVAVTSGAYSSGSFSANLTKSSFELGTRYSVRAFATNGKPATVYSDTITFQPRSVTFNLNGHGSSTPSVQYVNNGGLATDPSYSESVTGYTFGGWYDNSDWTQGTQWNFGTSTVSGGNVTLYAKWTPNNYTINLDKDLTPTSAGTASIAVTFDDDNNLDGTPAITPPTKDGWTFAGYYTAKNGGGTQIIDASGNVIASAGGGSTYTDASKNWKYADDITLYAKWTCTVTWSVNGLTNVYSAQTLTYNGTSTKVASIPGPPSPASYCGDKFVGWTTTNIGSTGLDKDDDASEIADLNLFTDVAGSPDLKTVGNTTFYAVFADYDE